MQIQIKIIIGTIAFMLTMILLAFVGLREPQRLREYAAAETGRQVENGASIYEANCLECHGVNGMGVNGGECYDAAGESKACIGLQLNNASLVCGTKPARLDQQQWLGSKYDYINGTLNAGRPWANMPTWGQDFGGPLSYNQIDALTLYVLNWENDELCGAPPAPTTVWPDTVTALPVGDPASGEALFVSQACSGCHGNLEDEASSGTFPWLGNLAEVGATRKEGYSAADYTYESILLVNAYISTNWAVCSGLSPEECQNVQSAMNPNYWQTLDEQEMADIMAYLLGSGEFETAGAIIDVAPINPEPVEEAPADDTPTDDAPADAETGTDESP
jgi:mono/diheme cytochrome c family protein